MPKRLYRPREAEAETHLPRDVIYALLHSGQLASVRIGQRFYIPEAAIEDLIARIQRGELREVR